MKITANKVIKRMTRAAEKRAWKRGYCPTRGKMLGRKASLIQAYFWD